MRTTIPKSSTRKPRAPVILLLILVIISATFAQTTRPPLKEDTQFWNDIQITAPVTKQVDFLNDWVRNRFSVGGSRAINKRLAFDLYYMRQNDGRARPGDLNIIGTVLRVRP